MTSVLRYVKDKLSNVVRTFPLLPEKPKDSELSLAARETETCSDDMEAQFQLWFYKKILKVLYEKPLEFSTFKTDKEEE